jgi:RNA polymerase sigma-70 factor (family 1)
LKENIIKNIRRGDRKAFSEVFDHFFNALAAFAYKYVNDVNISEDMAQEAFISFWEGRENFENLAAVKSFLYTSVRNKCLNHIKHENVKKKHEPSLGYEFESDQFFGDQVIEEEVFNALYTQIKDLPKSAQEIMLLSLNGLKNAEIAEELEISINTVKTQKKIAYSKIKDKLDPMLRMIVLILISS